MFRADAIKDLIEQALPECTALVYDDANDGEHFRAEVVSSAFDGINLVKQHQMVYAALGDWILGDSAPIHALQLSTSTPEESA